MLLGVSVAIVCVSFAGTRAVAVGFPLASGKDRIGCTDGLRGYLALFVLAHHFFIWVQIDRPGGTWAKPTVDVFNNFGQGTVALFFMTTGLVFYPYILSGSVYLRGENLHVT